MKAVKPSRSVKAIVALWRAPPARVSSTPTVSSWMAFNPMLAMSDGSCSMERSRKRWTTSSDVAVRMGRSVGCSSQARSMRPTSEAPRANSGCSFSSAAACWVSRRRIPSMALSPLARAPSSDGMGPNLDGTQIGHDVVDPARAGVP